MKEANKVAYGMVAVGGGGLVAVGAAAAGAGALVVGASAGSVGAGINSVGQQFTNTGSVDARKTLTDTAKGAVIGTGVRALPVAALYVVGGGAAAYGTYQNGSAAVSDFQNGNYTLGTVHSLASASDAALGIFTLNNAAQNYYNRVGLLGGASGGGIPIRQGNPTPPISGEPPASTAPATTETPGSYLAGKAPKQVTPGTRVLEGQHVNDLGRVEPWTAHYDEYGRLIGRTDFNAGNRAADIPDTHYHTYEWGPGMNPLETGSHLPGEFQP